MISRIDIQAILTQSLQYSYKVLTCAVILFSIVVVMIAIRTDGNTCLILQEKPRLYPERVLVVIGESVSITCMHSSDTQAEWFRDGNIEVTQGLVYYRKGSYNMPALSVFTIPRVNASHNNTHFHCQLASEIKSATATIFVIDEPVLAAVPQ